jgi:hypothetical protein
MNAPTTSDVGAQQRRGGCRPRMSGCRPDCRHRDMVYAYRAARAAAEAARETVCLGYATEEAGYGPLVTFGDWLTSWSGSNRTEPGRAMDEPTGDGLREVAAA